MKEIFFFNSCLFFSVKNGIEGQSHFFHQNCFSSLFAAFLIPTCYLSLVDQPSAANYLTYLSINHVSASGLQPLPPWVSYFTVLDILYWYNTLPSTYFPPFLLRFVSREEGSLLILKVCCVELTEPTKKISPIRVYRFCNIHTSHLSLSLIPLSLSLSP